MMISTPGTGRGCEIFSLLLITMSLEPATGGWFAAVTGDCDETEGGGGGFPDGGGVDCSAGMQAIAGITRHITISNNAVNFAEMQRMFILCIVAL